MSKRELETYWFGRCKGDFGPIRWQGWAAVAVYVAVAAGAAVLLAERTLLGFLAILIIATALFLIVCHNKTRDGLRLSLWPHRPSGKARRR